MAEPSYEIYYTHPGMAQLEFLFAMQRAEHQTYLDEKASVAQNNRAAYVENQRAWGKTRAVAYKTSISHIQDSRAREVNLSLMSQDYRIQAGQRAQAQVAKYAGAGTLIAGSAAKRLEMTRTRGEAGAERLEGRARLERERGEYAADTLIKGQVRPEYVPTAMPAPVEDPDDETLGKGSFYAKRKELLKRWQDAGFNQWQKVDALPDQPTSEELASDIQELRDIMNTGPALLDGQGDGNGNGSINGGPNGMPP